MYACTYGGQYWPEYNQGLPVSDGLFQWINDQGYIPADYVHEEQRQADDGSLSSSLFIIAYRVAMVDEAQEMEK